MTEAQKSVREFMLLGGYDLPSGPAIPTADMRKLCASLILEEALETIAALGFGVMQMPKDGAYLTNHNVHFIDDPTMTPDLVEFADGAADTHYVVNFAANACGIDLEPVDLEVCRSNLSKFEWTKDELGRAMASGHKIWTGELLANGKYLARVQDQAGKIQKPPGYSKADIALVLKRQSN